MRCPGEVVTRGWWLDTGGYWWAVDACTEHASHLSPARPGPAAKFGHSRPPFPAGGRRQSSGRPRAEARELVA